MLQTKKLLNGEGTCTSGLIVASDLAMFKKNADTAIAGSICGIVVAGTGPRITSPTGTIQTRTSRSAQDTGVPTSLYHWQSSQASEFIDGALHDFLVEPPQVLSVQMPLSFIERRRAELYAKWRDMYVEHDPRGRDCWTPLVSLHDDRRWMADMPNGKPLMLRIDYNRSAAEKNGANQRNDQDDWEPKR